MLAPVPGAVVGVDRLTSGISLGPPTSCLSSMNDWAVTEYNWQVACADAPPVQTQMHA